jgi:hypothetical protein
MSLTDSDRAIFEAIDQALMSAATHLQGLLLEGARLTTTPQFRLLELMSAGPPATVDRSLLSDVHYVVKRDGQVIHQLGRPAEPAVDRVTEDEIMANGWNSPEHDNPRLNAAIQAQQMNLVGRLLLEIRDLLESGG